MIDIGDDQWYSFFSTMVACIGKNSNSCPCERGLNLSSNIAWEARKGNFNANVKHVLNKRRAEYVCDKKFREMRTYLLKTPWNIA
jgi:hypothetical protein